jgi:trehalose 2-sulfotransferase
VNLTSSYLICTTPRSGSALLCAALAGTGVAGCPEEYFYEKSEPEWARKWGLGSHSYAEYLEAVLEHGSTPNGVFGVKMMWSLLDRFACEIRQIPGYAGLELPGLLSAVFPNLRYVWLKRQDKVAQAVSHWKAIQTGVWHTAEGEGQVPTKVPEYDFEAIDHLVREAEAHDAAWQQYFVDNDIEPFTVVYETFVETYEETVCDVLAFLSISASKVSPAGPRTIKQADDVSVEWIKRYLGAVGNTRSTV